jgi:hypothetical protein
MSLRLRRGTNAQRASIIFDAGEPIFVQDKQQVWVGDGVTQGGIDPIQSYAGTGLHYSYSSQNGGKLAVNLGDLNADSLPGGTNNKYFSNQLAQDAFGALISNGIQTGITLQYDPSTHALNATVTLDGTYNDIVQDTSPQLGGDLDLNEYNVIGTGNIEINGYNLVQNNNSEQSLIGLVAAEGYYSDQSPTIIRVQRGRGTAAAPLPVQTGDVLGGIVFSGTTESNGNYSTAAAIIANSVGTVGAGSLPGRLDFWYYESGSGHVAGYSGKYGIGSAIAVTVANYANNTARNAAIPPGNEVAGMIVLNNGVFQGWNGSAWVTLG